MAMGQTPNRVAHSEHPNSTTKIASKMGGEFTYNPMVLTHSQIGIDPQPNQKEHNPTPKNTVFRLSLCGSVAPDAEPRESAKKNQLNANACVCLCVIKCLVSFRIPVFNGGRVCGCSPSFKRICFCIPTWPPPIHQTGHTWIWGQAELGTLW